MSSVTGVTGATDATGATAGTGATGGTAMADDRFEEHMSDSDALMWTIEKDPLLRSTIVTALMLDHTPDFDRLTERLDRGSRAIPRMRQRVVSPMMRLGPPFWSADPDFDLAYHVRRVRAPEGAGMDAVLDVARTAAMQSFDRARPLWEYTLVEGLDDGRAAMVIKVHHSMTDGVGGMKLLLMLFDFERDARAPLELPDDLAEPPVLDRMALVGRSLSHRRRRALGIARRGAIETGRAATALVRDPMGSVRGAGAAATSVARYLRPTTEPCSPVMRARTMGRRLATFDIPLPALKGAARAAGGSVNDAFVAGVLGGLGRYHQLHGHPVERLRMVMPVNLRAEGDALGGNHFTPARFLVPTAIDDPSERVREVSRLSRAMREQPAIHLTDALAGVLNQFPSTVTTQLFGSMLKGSDFVTTNIPGSPVPLYVGGAELERLYAFAPLTGTALNVSLVSLRDTCCVGVVTDLVAVPDTATMVKCLEAGFDEVLAVGG